MGSKFAAYWGHSYRHLAPTVAIFVIAVSLPSFQLFQERASSMLLIHMLMELFAIFVAGLIAVMSWHSLKHRPGPDAGILLAGFALVAAIDLMHMLAYDGMPPFVTENSANRSIFFWLAGRTAVVATLTLLLFRVRLAWSRWIWLAGAALGAAAVFLVGTYDLGSLPVMHITGIGVTAFKRDYEYGLSVSDVVLAGAFIYRATMLNRRQFFAIASSCLIMGMGEIVFSHYRNVSDFLNIFGHVFKVLSYIFLYRSIFVTAVEQPYELLHDSEDSRKASEERFALIMRGTNDGLWEWNLEDNEVYYSPRWKSMLGYRDDEVENTLNAWLALVHPDDRNRVLAGIADYAKERKESFSTEMRLRHKDGHWISVLSRAFLAARASDGHPVRLIGTNTDITDLREKEALILKQANYDTLTGMPNRRLFYDRLELEIRKAERVNSRLALLFIDLDRFKDVNDTLGHSKGDRLLLEAASRITQCVRESDTIARLGGDEFTIILTDVGETIHLEHLAQDIIQSLAAPFDLGDNDRGYISASVGIALYPDDATDEESLIKHADRALYQAKAEGRGRFSYFTQSMQAQALEKLALTNDLRQALSRRELEVYYQPIVEVASGRITKAEALLRWHHPVRGTLSPGLFIPLAEEARLIDGIGNWVFDQALDSIARCHEMFGCTIQMSVNKSPLQFGSGTQDGWLERMERDPSLAGCIAVEITEGLLLSESDGIRDRLLDYRNRGIEVSIDDFGTGFSALSYLKRFDIDYLKIDRSFVQQLAENASDRALTEAIVVMAHKLGIKVIAEGVETAVQRDLLAGLGCDYLQGYLYSPPVPQGQFIDMLARQPH
ncbi:MAG TPA: EAL domain-containing protein [Gallionellaceae bacterium]|nr:EAL domain-containing protein [Gallionellaceae bacterium]